MISILSIILLVLLIIVGKTRGIKTFATFYLSFLLILIYIVLLRLGANPIIFAIIICIIASSSTLFIINGVNIKTKASFYSIMFILLFIYLLISVISHKSHIQGFSVESIENIGAFSYDIGVNMIDIIIGMYLICIIGTVIDTSISISSAMNEVLENNPHLNSKELYKSGMNVGSDILATTINTLFFAMLSSFIGFFLWHRGVNFGFILNYKSFGQELIQLLISFIGSILIIPITAYVTSKMLKKEKIIEFKKQKRWIK